MAFTRRPVKQRAAAATQLPSIAIIKAYLKKQGWTCDYVWQGKIEYHIHKHYPNEELKLTVDKSIKDYDKRLDMFFDELAELEYKKVEDLVREIKDLEKPTKVVEKVVEVRQEKPQPKDEIGGRDEKGCFKKGHEFGKLPKSINGQSICKYRGILGEDMALYLAELKMMALAEAVTVPEKQLKLSAIKLIVDAVLPPPKASTYADVEIDTTNLKTLTSVKEESARIVKHLEGAGASVETITAMLELMQVYTKFIEMADIEPRMREIEQVINAQKVKG